MTLFTLNNDKSLFYDTHFTKHKYYNLQLKTQTFYSNNSLNNKTSTYKHRIEFRRLVISYSYSETFYSFKYQFHYLHAVQNKPCVNMESS